MGFTLTIVSLVLIAALWVGVDVLVQRYSQLFAEEAMLREGRLLVFRDGIKMIRAHPMGVGTGAFQDRFREYQTFRPELLFDHAHNDYIETAAEWGIPVSLAFWTCIFFSLLRAIRLFVLIESPEKRGILLACIGAILSIALHSFADFNLQIPANAMLFFTFVGISLAISPEQDRSSLGYEWKNA